MSQKKKKNRHDRRTLPPMNRTPENLADRRLMKVVEVGVGSWCPSDDGSGPAEAVVLHLKIATGGKDFVEFGLSLKSPEAVNELIDMLVRHRNDVWPAAPAGGGGDDPVL
jgi:hypothetical protein